MIKINNKYYKICLVDTNIISDTLKMSQDIHKYFINLLSDNYIFAFSDLTLVEMSKRNELLNQFKIFIKSIPVFFLKPSYQIAALEKSHYPIKLEPKDIILFVVNQNHNINSQDLREYLETNNFKEISRDLAKIQSKLHSENRFEEEVTAVKKSKIDAIKYCDDLLKINLIKKKENFNVSMEDDYFPSQKMEHLLKYYNYHYHMRKPKNSDTFDRLICSSLPYVDLFITEKNLSLDLKKIKENHNIIDHLEILIMKDLRDN